MPRLRVMLLFYLISEIFSEEILSDFKLLPSNSSEEIIIPSNSAQFFRNSLKCCHHSSAYNSTKRVCVNSTGSGSSRWKQVGDPIDLKRVHGTPNCSIENVLVDYEIVVKVEKEIWESEEEKPITNSTETNCTTDQCVTHRVKRNVSTLSDEVETFSVENFNQSTADHIGRLKVLTAVMVAGGVLDEFVDGLEDLTLLPNGTLRLGKDSYARGEFCIDGRDGEEDTFILTMRVCESSNRWCIPERACVRKCCRDGESMLEKEEMMDDGHIKKKRKCSPSEIGFQIQKLLPTDMPLGVYNGEMCGKRSKYILTPETNPDDGWHLLSNGSLLVPLIHPTFFHQRENCMERVYDPNRNMDGLYAYLCFPELTPVEADPRVDEVVYPVALLISCLFLTATLAVYALLPSLRNLHGLTLVSHASCLLAAFIFLAAVKLTKEMARGTTECKILGYSVLFTFLAALSWLNVMCFDIWWTFGRFHGMGPGQRGASGKDGGLKGNILRYVYYSIYAWMLPLTITAFTVVADKYGKDFLPYAPPGIGSKKCWFEDDGKIAVIIHFLVPSTILLMADVIMFVLTALRCWKVKAEIHRMQSQDKDDLKKNGENPKLFRKRWWKKKYRGDKDRMVMNLKLCAAMGINWSLEFVSWWLSREKSHSKRLLPLATWYASDIANCLHGVFVFIVFVGKKKIMKQLWKRLKDICSCCEKKFPRQTTRNSSLQDSCNTPSMHGNVSSIEEKTYNFRNGRDVKPTGLRKWLNSCGFCVKPLKSHNFNNRCLSQTSTSSTNISGELSHGRVSYTP